MVGAVALSLIIAPPQSMVWETNPVSPPEVRAVLVVDAHSSMASHDRQRLFRNLALLLAGVVAFLTIAAQGSRCGGGKLRQLYEPAAAINTPNSAVTFCALADAGRAQAVMTMKNGEKREHHRVTLSAGPPLLSAAPAVLSARAGLCPDVQGTQPEMQRVLRI